MLAQLAVLRNLLVNEVYLLPKRLDGKMARLHLPLLVQCSLDARTGKCMVHKLMDAEVLIFVGSRVDPAQNPS